MEPIMEQMDDRLLLINLYVTQGITFVLGLLGLVVIYGKEGTDLFSLFYLPNGWTTIRLAIITAAAVILIDVTLSVCLPKHYMDDGGINEKLFATRSLWHIVLMVALIAFSEELLFRVVIQSMIGNLLASILFSFIHIRYIKKWVMFSSVFIISLILGWLFSETSSALAPILCHFIIDFVLAVLIRFHLLKT